MRKSIPYEILSAISAIVGAFILVGIYYPLLNPVQYGIDSHEDSPSVWFYIIATPFPLVILAASWYFNRKAQRMKRDEHDHKPSA
jgi:H+/Cl- antiporter ClcA